MSKRPGWITFIAWWQILGAVTMFFVLFVPKSESLEISWLNYVSVAFGLLGFIIGIGLLKLKEWARILAILSYSVAFLGILSSRIEAQIAIFGSIDAAIVVYLSRKKTREVFKSAPRQKKSTSVSLSTAEKGKLLGTAYLYLGTVSETQKKAEEAFQSYKKAKKYGAKLPDHAVVLLGDCYAQKGTTGDDAVDAYLRYIKLVRSPQGASKKVYAQLDSICTLDEASRADRRRSLIALNRKVVEANPNIEWAHYYLGLGYFLSQEYSAGITSFSNALRLNPDRKLTYYWLGKCLVLSGQMPPPYQTFEVLDTFLAFSLDETEGQVKQADAAFQLGKLVMNALGGFEATLDLKNQNIRARSEEAIGYLETAVKKDGTKADYFFHLGKAYAISQSPLKAIQSYEKAIELAPKEKVYYYCEAVEYWNIGKLVKVKSCLEVAIGLDSNDVPAIGLLAKTLLRLKEYAEAEHQCRIVQRLNASDKGTIPILLQSLYYQNKYREVLQLAEQQTGFGLDNEEVQEAGFCIARSYAKTGNWANALERYRDLPQSPRNLYYRGCACTHEGNNKEALVLFSKVIEQKKDFVAQALEQRGHIWLKSGKIKEAEGDYRLAQKLDPNNSSVYSCLGLVHFNDGSDDKAADYFLQAIKLDAGNALAHLGMGLIFERGGDTKRAFKEYENALADSSGPVEASVRLGILAYQQKNYEKSLEHLRHAREAGAESDSVLFYLGMGLMHTDRIDEALEVWSPLQQRHADDERLELNISRAHYLLGLRYLKENRFADAISMWTKYLKQYATDDKTWREIGELHFRIGLQELSKGEPDLRKAVDSFRNAAEIDRENPRFQFYASICDLALGNQKEAFAQLTKLVKDHPNDSRMKYHLGLCMLKKGERQKAQDLLLGLVDGSKKDVYSNLAVSAIANEHIKERRYEKAISVLELIR